MRDAILDTITVRALKRDTIDAIVEYLIKEGVTSEDTVMIMDTTERQLVAIVMFDNRTIALPFYMSEEENQNLRKIMDDEMNIKNN